MEIENTREFFNQLKRLSHEYKFEIDLPDPFIKVDDMFFDFYDKITGQKRFSPSAIKNILYSILEKWSGSHVILFVNLIRYWPVAVGESLAEKTCPGIVTERGKLIINVPDSAYSFELDRGHKRNIIEYCNTIAEGLGIQFRIKDLSFHVVPWDKINVRKRNEKKFIEDLDKKKVLLEKWEPDVELTEIASKNIKNESLRKSFINAFSVLKHRNEVLKKQ